MEYSEENNWDKRRYGIYKISVWNWEFNKEGQTIFSEQLYSAVCYQRAYHLLNSCVYSEWTIILCQSLRIGKELKDGLRIGNSIDDNKNKQRSITRF